MDFGALNGLEYETLGLGLSIRRLEIEVSTPCEDKNMIFFIFYFSHHCELVSSS